MIVTAAGEITLVLGEEDNIGLQQALGQLEGILFYQLMHQEAFVRYDSQKISYDQILETILQASYRISRYYVTEMDSYIKENEPRIRDHAKAVIVFGPGKLPELGKSLGRGIKEFKNETDGKEKEAKKKLAERNDDIKEDK